MNEGEARKIQGDNIPRSSLESNDSIVTDFHENKINIQAEDQTPASI